MPSPVLIVGGVLIAVGAGIAFKEFVYDPYLSDRVHEFVEELAQQRDNRHRRLVEPHQTSPTPNRGNRSPPPRGVNPIEQVGSSSTGTEMRQVSGILRRRDTPGQNSSEVELGVIGHPISYAGVDNVSDAARQLTIRPEPIESPPPHANISSPPVVTSPRSPFSDLHALSEISFASSSSSDEYDQLSPPAVRSPPVSVAAAPFSPFVLPNSPLVELQRPASPWSELSAHSAATTSAGGQLHLRLSRTDTDSELDNRSESGSDGSWEHT